MTPTEIVVEALSDEPIEVDTTTVTGSLPVLRETVAAIGRGRHVERTSAEQRQIDLDEQLHQVAGWWRELTQRDIEETMPKAVEYGAGDLDMMGQAMLMLQGDVWEGGDETERRAIGQELAVLFYIHGKLARALSAAQQGRRVSDDTIKDIRIYSVMLERIRQAGTWVG